MCSRNDLPILLMLYLLLATDIATACQAQNKRPSKCTLPPYPDNGRYEVAGYPHARPGDELEYVYLNVSCERGHGVLGNNVLVCVQGEWATATIPQCESACYLKQHPSVTYACHRPGAEEFGSCSEIEPQGTFVEPKCRPDYHKQAMSLMRCVDGNWTYEAQCSKGPECEWEGVWGQCVPETRCLTTLAGNSSNHPVCARTGEQTFTCCTDYELVNNKDVAVNKTLQYNLKNGRKARDNCLQYRNTLPYKCQPNSDKWIGKQIKKGNKCNGYLHGAEDPASLDSQPNYPHEVLLGFIDSTKNRTAWNAGGFIISDRFILTAAQSWSPKTGPKLLGMGVKNRTHSKATWQIRKAKRFILHPEYKTHVFYNDIALIETDTPIKFDENVLPVCLHLEEGASVENAVTTTWFPLKDSLKTFADTIQTIKLEEYSDEECRTELSQVQQNYKHNSTLQVCYGSKTNETDPAQLCSSWLGSPLLVITEFSCCMYLYTAIGISSNVFNCKTNPEKPVGFTRIAHYVPRIESIVWP